MPVISLRYRFRQWFNVPARAAFLWCTDFEPEDGKLFSERTKRSIRRIAKDALIMTDTTYPSGRPLRISRLVRLNADQMAWTNTHLDGPYRHSQFWYKIVADGPRRSHLEFEGLRLETTKNPLSEKEIRRRARECQKLDSGEWRRRLAPALDNSEQVIR